MPAEIHVEYFRAPSAAVCMLEGRGSFAGAERDAIISAYPGDLEGTPSGPPPSGLYS